VGTWRHPLDRWSTKRVGVLILRRPLCLLLFLFFFSSIVNPRYSLLWSKALFDLRTRSTARAHAHTRTAMRKGLQRLVPPIMTRSCGVGAVPTSAHAFATSSAASQSSSQYAIRGALVRGLPSTFANGLKLEQPGEPIDLALAAQQHGAYTKLLQGLVERVIEVPADPSTPDCVFIEDTAVVTRGGIAIVSRPGESGAAVVISGSDVLCFDLLTLFPPTPLSTPSLPEPLCTNTPTRHTHRCTRAAQ